VISLDIKDPRHPEYGTLTLIMVRNPAAPGGYQLDSWVTLDRRTSAPRSPLEPALWRADSGQQLPLQRSAAPDPPLRTRPLRTAPFHRSCAGGGSSSFPLPLRQFAKIRGQPFIVQQAALP
jgi:hypothetical protein